jgi:hypothetical protein
LTTSCNCIATPRPVRTTNTNLPDRTYVRKYANVRISLRWLIMRLHGTQKDTGTELPDGRLSGRYDMTGDNNQHLWYRQSSPCQPSTGLSICPIDTEMQLHPTSNVDCENGREQSVPRMIG